MGGPGAPGPPLFFMRRMNRCEPAPLIPILLLALVACSGPVTSDQPAADSPDVADAITINLADFMIDPSELEAAGPTVTLEVAQRWPTPHNLTVRNAAGDVLMATDDLSAGDTDTISAELEPGEYTIFCSFAGHESLGMSGKRSP